MELKTKTGLSITGSPVEIKVMIELLEHNKKPVVNEGVDFARITKSYKNVSINVAKRGKLISDDEKRRIVGIIEMAKNRYGLRKTAKKIGVGIRCVLNQILNKNDSGYTMHEGLKSLVENYWKNELENNKRTSDQELSKPETADLSA